MSFNWTLPPSPDHRLYRQILAEIEAAEKDDPIEAMLMFRAVAEADLWFFQWQVMSLGNYRVDERQHPHFGKLWVKEPWFFDRMREAQQSIVQREDNVWWKWFRHSFKSAALTKGSSIWILCRDKTEQIAIFTHKVDQIGESFGDDILREIQNSEALLRHWPQFRNLREASDTRITVDRPLGPKDPSISIHPIRGSAASMHPTWVWVDDAVNEQIVESRTLLGEVDNKIKLLVPLAGGRTAIQFIGTPWGGNDPLVKRERDGFFSRVSSHPAHVKGKAQLRTEAFFRKQRKGMRDDYLYFSQFELEIRPRGDRYFQDPWRRYYDKAPRVQAIGTTIDIILDMGGGGEDADYTVARVRGLAYDGRKYNLDLWRERIGLNDTLDLLFGKPREWRGEDFPWPEEGLVKTWQKVDKQLVVWVEEFGASAWYEAITADAKRRKIRVVVKRLPKVNRPKPTRIRLLQTAYRDGEILYPAGGFGHGSVYGENGESDQRDTMHQFFEDEYSLWSLEYGAKKDAVDDMLDTEAWPEQPEVLKMLRRPTSAAAGNVYAFSSGHQFIRGERKEPSWHAY